jgi:hypothetical protein
MKLHGTLFYESVVFKIMGCEIYKYGRPWPAAVVTFMRNIAAGKTKI